MSNYIIRIEKRDENRKLLFQAQAEVTEDFIHDAHLSEVEAMIMAFEKTYYMLKKEETKPCQI